MKRMTSKPGKPINIPAGKLDAINRTIEKLKAEQEKIIEQIRKSSREAVVVFVDMAGSTQNKLDHKTEPERWIFNFRQFYDVVSECVQQLGGRVVKYIGDEVM